MNVFLTGSTGYIGQALIQQLLQKKVTIIALCRPGSDRKALQHPQIRIVEGDLSTTEVLRKGMQSCEQVYHLAAYARVWSKDKSVYREVNVDGTRHVLEAASAAGVRKVVFTSTAGVLGPAVADRKPVDENTQRVQPFFNEYEQTKWEAEQLCLHYARESNLSVVIVNPSRVYGPGADTESNAISKLTTLFLRGKWRFIPGDGQSLGNYTYLDDVVDGHLAAMAKGRSGERYILGGENVTFDEFFHLLRKLSGKDVALYHLPIAVMLGFAKVESMKASLLDIRPLITSDWVKKYLFDWPLTSGKAMRELGYSITSLPVGLGKTILQLQSKIS